MKRYPKQPTLPEILGQRLDTLTVPHQARVLTIILTDDLHTIVLTPSAVPGPIYLLILVQNLSVNDSLECLIQIQMQSTQSL